MNRKIFKQRLDYHRRLDEIGFQYHSVRSSDGEEYWTEGAAYEFTFDEIERIEAAAEALHKICLETVADIVRSGDYPQPFALGDRAKTLIEDSWRRADAHVYGRFDLLFDPSSGAIKMYEYNADTPTALLEAAVAQWHWLEETEAVPHRDQFNSIHEKLVARWQQIKPPNDDAPVLYALASKEGHYEDWGNVEYLADTAMQGGWRIHIEEIENVGYDARTGSFVDAAGARVEHAFKLYPWEWMIEEDFGEFVRSSPTRWFEPPWKMLLSNKAILPVLWRRYPEHQHLLPAFFENDRPLENFRHMFVKKPILGREGANVHLAGTFADTLLDGSHRAPEYDSHGYVYQQYAPLPKIDGKHPVVGAWIVGDDAAGIGVREDNTIVSGNGSHFVPHYFVE